MPIGLVSCTGLHSDQCDEFDLCPFVLVNKLLSASEVLKHRWYAIKSEISILALWPNADSEVRTPRVLRLSISLLSIVYRGCTANFISRLPSFLPSFIRSPPPFFAAQRMRRPSINVIGVNLSYRLRYCPSCMVEVMTKPGLSTHTEGWQATCGTRDQ